MAFKFRKRIKVLPGVTLNVSKSGVSTTVGAKGLSVNVGKKGTYLNTGIPGTGIYDRQKIAGNTSNKDINYSNYNNTYDSKHSQVPSYKSKKTAMILALVLGSFGAHKFYLKNTGLGVVMLLFCWSFIPTIIGLIDFLKFLLMSKDKFDSIYNYDYVYYHIEQRNQKEDEIKEVERKEEIEKIYTQTLKEVEAMSLNDYISSSIDRTLKQDEHCYFESENVELYTIKRDNLTLDDKGTIFITSNNVLFVGNKKTRNIKLDTITNITISETALKIQTVKEGSSLIFSNLEFEKVSRISALISKLLST